MNLFPGIFAGDYVYGFPAHGELFRLDGTCDPKLDSQATIISLLLRTVPRFPDGYGDPTQQPLYPQLTAELMAGRRAISPDQSSQALSLDEAIVGPATALEIRWPQHAL